MKITLNGEERTLHEECTIAQLIREARVNARACAVEINRTLIPKREHDKHHLNDGDSVELVTLVGGG